MFKVDLYHETHRHLDQTLARVVEYGIQSLGRRFLDETWYEFTSWIEPFYPLKSKRHQLFLTWLAYDWVPMSSHEYRKKLSIDSLPTTLGESFLCHCTDEIDELTRATIRNSVTHTVSFYEVKTVESSTLTIEDLLFGSFFQIIHPWKAQQCQVGDMLFGIPCGTEEFLTLACCHRVIPNKFKKEILCFKQWTKEVLMDPLIDDLQAIYHPEILELFWTIQHQLLKGNSRVLPEGVVASPNSFHTFLYSELSC